MCHLRSRVRRRVHESLETEPPAEEILVAIADGEIDEIRKFEGSALNTAMLMFCFFEIPVTVAYVEKADRYNNKRIIKVIFRP
jgi:hypothetical protein